MSVIDILAAIAIMDNAKGEKNQTIINFGRRRG